MSGFWTTRRAAVAAEAQADQNASLEAASEAQEAALAERDDVELLSELGLPAPEELLSGEQLRAFLKAQLPQRLKSRALRAFWRTNPVLACLDGLNDYEDDYTAAATAGKAVNTLYVVGKGFAPPVADALEKIMEEDEEPALIAMSERSVPDVSPPQAVEVETQDAEEYDVAGSEVERDEEEFAAITTPRRMRFTFSTDAEGAGV
ncbi:DUF3306 domain-containing protein [Sulfitobacter sp. S223]|uniref:DUF3306 domain-containing protein n=1 Tax=Sulfitobacter sp. S223 TaxID=2867023 RepID=UPI0021A5703B|nr:DUF3306 domain-containing protein [Sulfitobacter sp. S223]UWR25690.1 DUF3306 domain-containing protein [Sulfitobacter sp. S223]